MRYLVTGATGFIGTPLCERLAAEGGQLVVVSRDPARALTLLPGGTRAVRRVAELDRSEAFDVVINLAGEPIANGRWTAARKQLLESSRVDLTRELVDWMAQASTKPATFVSASAIGWYGDQGDATLTEQSPAHDEYQHRLCQAWETAALGAQSLGVRTAVLRIGLVVGRDGGFLARMLLPFRLGVGGPVGHGRQWMSWVHREDIIGMIERLVADDALQGVFNGTAPAPVTSREFARTLGRVLHRPAVLPLPGIALQAAFGEMSRLLLTGQRVLPARFQAAGYAFRYPDLESALKEAL